MQSPPADRIDVLARRVRWLDRYRRALSVPFAIGIWIIVSRYIAGLFEGDWPGVIPGAAAMLFAVTAWWILEIAFAWTIALWETEHDKLSRDRGLPRAQLVRSRRRK